MHAKAYFPFPAVSDVFEAPGRGLFMLQITLPFGSCAAARQACLAVLTCSRVHPCTLERGLRSCKMKYLHAADGLFSKYKHYFSIKVVAKPPMLEAGGGE